jgi:hypothetical protein
MITSHGIEKTPVLASCQCGDDPQLQLLRDLMNAGMDQIPASRIAFGNTPSPRALPAVWSAWTKVEARRLGNSLRRRLGLPELPLAEAVAAR